MPSKEHVDLHDNTLLRGIPPERLREARVALQRTVFAPGDIIFEEDSSGDSCFLVESGLVRISKATADGSQETLGFVGAGDFFGELALYYSAPRSARATAVAATRVGLLDRQAFDRLRSLAPLELTTAIASAGLARLRALHSVVVQQLADSDRFREIGVSVGMIAHDMRSPLATIRLSADLVLELIAEGRHDAATLAKYVDVIRRTANGALESADALLARVRGEPQRDLSSVAVPVLVREATEQILGLVSERGADFESVVEHRGAVTCEHTELVRALVNVLRNALEALPPSGGRVVLRATGEEDDVVFVISDTGRGIPPEYHGRIFERRFTMGKPGGTGLGLDQVRRVVERHGGSIGVESQVGEGATFRIRLPARAPRSRANLLNHASPASEADRASRP